MDLLGWFQVFLIVLLLRCDMEFLIGIFKDFGMISGLLNLHNESSCCYVIQQKEVGSCVCVL